MVRVYFKKIGGRPYKCWTEETMSKALEEIKAKKLSIRQAARKYQIHRNTLNNRLHQTHQRKTGGQTALSAKEEKIIVSHIITLSIYGFPISNLELRLFIQSYLTRIDRTVKQFTNNLPGKDWVSLFLNRHKKELCSRLSQTISRSRAALDGTIINEFFDNLERELEGITPDCIWNYDESNLQDNPGLKKILVKRGAKHPDIIQNATKASISIMVCGNATGYLAPIYVTYKAENLFQCWMEGGPPGTRYNRSKSGWFDATIFEDWFEFLMLPILKKQVGTKVLIGDNLSSHINYHVLDLCHENNIKFIALPPHSTHLLQPLDVAFFRPMKIAWRCVLNEWKESVEGRARSALPKTAFPRLLTKLMKKLEDNSCKNLITGFRACGIHPLNRNEVLKKLCNNVLETSGEHVQNVSAAFIDELKKKRNDTCSITVRRKKKVNVPPGKGITVEDVQGKNSLEQTQSSTSQAIKHRVPQKKTKQTKKGPARKKRLLNRNREFSSDDEDFEIPYAESADSLGSFQDFLDDDLLVSFTSEESNQDNNTIEPLEIGIGDYVIVDYHGRLYPGKMISNFDESGEVNISAMKKKGKYWTWPKEPDEIWYKKKQIKKKIPPPKKIGTSDVYFVDMKP